MELGLVYRPASQGQLEGHLAKLTAMMIDVADVPPDCLAKAIQKWKRESPFMPKASDLIELSRQFVGGNRGGRIDFETIWNADLQRRGITHMRWRDDNGQMKLESA